MRRFLSPISPLAFAARHRAFAARLRNAREEGRAVPPIGQILRRSDSRVLLQRVWMPLQFALQVIQRAAAPWNPPLPAVLPAPLPSPETLRERFHLSTRLLERTLRFLQVRHTQMPVSVAPPAAAMPSNALPSTRLLMMQRIERQALFPRVTQVLVRSAAPAAAHGEARVQALAQVSEPRTAPRPSTAPATPVVVAPLPAVELSRVTDHVIKQLDRRVLSYRERMGQV